MRAPIDPHCPDLTQRSGGDLCSNSSASPSSRSFDEPRTDDAKTYRVEPAALPQLFSNGHRSLRSSNLYAPSSATTDEATSRVDRAIRSRPFQTVVWAA